MRPNKVQIRNPELIAETVQSLLATTYPTWSRDVLLCHPAAARAICKAVRRKLHSARGLEDFAILWTFLNQSKRSKLAAVAAASRRRRARSAS